MTETSELKNLKCITCLNDYNIQGASIDLSLNEKAKIRLKKDIDLFNADALESEDLFEEIDLAQGYNLAPCTYLYGSSVEKITIPKDKCALLLPRSTFARLGLILPVSHFANPGYSGHLPIIIFNASGSFIKIPPYIRIMQIVFLELKGRAQEYKEQKDAKYDNEKPLKQPRLNDVELRAILEKLKR